MLHHCKPFAIAALIAWAGTSAIADKGIQVWGFKTVSAPALKFKWEDTHNLRDRTLEAYPSDKNRFLGGDTCWSNVTSIDSSFKIKLENPSGGTVLSEAVAQVNSVIGHSTLTGFNTGSGETVMGNIWDQPDGNPTQSTRFFEDDNLVLAYGFYNAGAKGDTPIQGHDQAYAYLTPSAQTWMGDIRAVDPATFDAATLGSVSFPGAHDAGMFTLASGIDSASDLSRYFNDITTLIPGNWILGYLEGLAGKAIISAVQNFALTQKDTSADALKAGVRFFDYRPGTPVAQIPGLGKDSYYHVHAVVPGYNFASFLGDVSTFLNDSANPHEIVIVNVKSSGIIPAVFTPLYDSDTPPENGYADAETWITANADFGDLSPLYVSDYADLSGLTLGEIYAANNRLIFFFGTGYNDSYPQNVPDDQNPYDTWDVSNVMGALADTLPSCQDDTGNFTVFQLQDTASSAAIQDWTNEANVLGNATASGNGSVLLATKGMWDYNTYNWAVGNLGSCKTMSVMLNDFAGNLLAYNAKTITAARMGITIPDGIDGPNHQQCADLNQ